MNNKPVTSSAISEYIASILGFQQSMMRSRYGCTHLLQFSGKATLGVSEEDIQTLIDAYDQAVRGINFPWTLHVTVRENSYQDFIQQLEDTQKNVTGWRSIPRQEIIDFARFLADSTTSCTRSFYISLWYPLPEHEQTPDTLAQAQTILEDRAILIREAFASCGVRPIPLAMPECLDLATASFRGNAVDTIDPGVHSTDDYISVVKNDMLPASLEYRDDRLVLDGIVHETFFCTTGARASTWLDNVIHSNEEVSVAIHYTPLDGGQHQTQTAVTLRSVPEKASLRAQEFLQEARQYGVVVTRATDAEQGFLMTQPIYIQQLFDGVPTEEARGILCSDKSYGAVYAGGILYGINRDAGDWVFFDRFQKNKALHSIVWGGSESRKSFWQKTELMRLVIQEGVEAVVIDTTGQYKPLARLLREHSSSGYHAITADTVPTYDFFQRGDGLEIYDVSTIVEHEDRVQAMHAVLTSLRDALEKQSHTKKQLIVIDTLSPLHTNEETLRVVSEILQHTQPSCAVAIVAENFTHFNSSVVGKDILLHTPLRCFFPRSIADEEQHIAKYYGISSLLLGLSSPDSFMLEYGGAVARIQNVTSFTEQEMYEPVPIPEDKKFS